MQNEIWKPIPEWQDSYHISNLGRVRSINRYGTESMVRIVPYKGRIRKTTTNYLGYEVVILMRGDRKKGYGVHRLVALAFLVPPDDPNKCEVHHINHIRNDNRVENLQWVTVKENRQMRSPHKHFPQIAKERIAELEAENTKLKALLALYEQNN